MGLRRIQQELAAILMEPDARERFARDRRRFLKARGLRGRDLRLLAGLAPADLAYFAERRNVDRLHALRADAPRATALLDTVRGAHLAYFRAFPYSLEDPRDETDRFARWCKQVAADGSAPPLLVDLALFDAAVLRMMASRAVQPKPSKWPRRAAGLRLLALGHAIGPALRSRDLAQARPGPATMALLRTADDVRWTGLSRLDEALLRGASGKATDAAWLKAAAAAAGTTVAQARTAARRLAREGLLAPRA